MDNWVVYKNALVPDIELHKQVDINQHEIRSLLKSTKAKLLRFTTDFDQNQISPAYYIIKDVWKGMEELGPNTRNKVRKSLKACRVELITKDVLYSMGYVVYQKHTGSYRSNLLDYDGYLEMIQNLEDREFFGCFDRQTNKLIGYAFNKVGEGVNYLLYKANPDYYKSHFPFYSLFYSMNEYYLNDQNKLYVSAGFRILDSHSNIQTFLMDRFKFRKAYCKLVVHYVWWLRLAVNIFYPFRRYIKLRSANRLLFQEEISRSSIKVSEGEVIR
jgi:hypothetical protein